MPAFALDGAVAVVTGGGSGSGRATTLALARSGVRVVVADLDKARALDAADAVRQTGADALGLECDVACEADLERLRAAALERFGQIHLLMNNVGVLPSGRFEDIPFKEWQRAVDVNLPSMVRSVQLFLPSLRSAGRAHIVNTASTAGLYAYAVDRLPYAVTKAAVVSFRAGAVPAASRDRRHVFVSRAGGNPHVGADPVSRSIGHGATPGLAQARRR
jgi:NAD(P)-dependent dehydrogenase (short-subunit alcohol dehydrogenase family)